MKAKYLTLILTLLCYTLSAQTVSKDTLQGYFMDDINYTEIKLPEISIFLEAAKSYSDVKIVEARKEEELQQLKITKKDWLGYVRLQGNYQYGTNNSYTSQTGEQLPPSYGYYSSNTRNWYNGGVVLSIPLNDIFSRKQKVGVIKSRIEQIEYEAERSLENRQLIILEAYNEVTKQLSLIKVKAEAVALYNAQMKISENDFVNGQIDIIALSLERGRRADAIVNYQESRAALHNAVTLLEMLTKVKIVER